MDPCYRPKVDEVRMPFFPFPSPTPSSYVRGLIGLLSTQGLTHRPQQYCVSTIEELIALKAVVLDDLISEL